LPTRRHLFNSLPLIIIQFFSGMVEKFPKRDFKRPQRILG
jgi:hypothetical protein